MSVSISEAAQDPKRIALQKAREAQQEADELNQRIAGLSRTPKKQRLVRLEEFQQKRREAVDRYYTAKEESERLFVVRSRVV